MLIRMPCGCTRKRWRRKPQHVLWDCELHGRAKFLADIVERTGIDPTAWRYREDRMPPHDPGRGMYWIFGPDEGDPRPHWHIING